MLLALSDGDFTAAKNANAFLYYTLFWLLLSVGLRRYYLSAGYVKILDRLLYPVYFLALVGFGIYRNLQCENFGMRKYIQYLFLAIYLITSYNYNWINNQKGGGANARK